MHRDQRRNADAGRDDCGDRYRHGRWDRHGKPYPPGLLRRLGEISPTRLRPGQGCGDPAAVRLGPNSHPTVDVQVGDVLTLTANEWLPDNPADPAELIDGSVVLAAVGGEGLTYQAVEVGSAVLPMGPVGHPGGCDQPGKNCTDATPPPSIFIAVGAR